MKSLAERYFDAQLQEMSLESEVTDALVESVGADPMDPDTWICEDFIFDYYDASFEFVTTKEGWEPTRAMRTAWGKRGFHRCGICYKERHGKDEKYYAL